MGNEAEGVKGAQTLMRALDILDQVITGPVRAVDLARELGMSKTTAHRLAHALRSRGYLSATRDGFSLGPKLLQLGALAEEQTDYVRLARPKIERLSEETGFCTFVGQREGDWSRHLDRVTDASACASRPRPETAAPSPKPAWARRCCSMKVGRLWQIYTRSRATGMLLRTRSATGWMRSGPAGPDSSCCTTASWAMPFGRSRRRSAMPGAKSALP